MVEAYPRPDLRYQSWRKVWRVTPPRLIVRSRRRRQAGIPRGTKATLAQDGPIAAGNRRLLRRSFFKKRRRRERLAQPVSATSGNRGSVRQRLWKGVATTGLHGARNPTASRGHDSMPADETVPQGHNKRGLDPLPRSWSGKDSSNKADTLPRNGRRPLFVES